jgi:hypothetical protein
MIDEGRGRRRDNKQLFEEIATILGHSSSCFGVVRVVAALAGFTAGVLLRVHLRDPFRPGHHGLMALRAERGGVWQGRLLRGWIVRVRGLGSVTRFASDQFVFRFCEDLSGFIVAGGAGFPARVVQWSGSGFSEGGRTVMPELAESGRHGCLSYHREHGNSGEQNHRESNQMGSLSHRGLLMLRNLARCLTRREPFEAGEPA